MPAELITGLRGVDLGVTDVAAQARFYTEVWRLAVVAERNGSVYLRGSGDYHHILALHPRAEPRLLCINLAAADRAGGRELPRASPGNGPTRPAAATSGGPRPRPASA